MLVQPVEQQWGRNVPGASRSLWLIGVDTLGPLSAGILMFWRGAWGLIDLVLFPDNDRAQCWGSIGAGSLIWILGWSLSFSGVLRGFFAKERHHVTLRTLAQRLAMYILSWGSVLVWRGCTGLSFLCAAFFLIVIALLLSALQWVDQFEVEAADQRVEDVDVPSSSSHSFRSGSRAP